VSDVIDVVTAAGTVGAAVFTAWAARAASAAAKTARDGVQAEGKPILIDVPRELYTDYEHEIPWPGSVRKTPMRGEIMMDSTIGTIVVPVRNVGRGLARIENYEVSLTDGTSHAQHSTTLVPPGEDAWLLAEPVSTSAFAQAIQATPSALHGPTPVIFTVTYTDALGNQRERLELGLGSNGADTAWRVLRTAHREASDLLLAGK